MDNLPIFRIVKEPTTLYTTKITGAPSASDFLRKIWEDSIGVYESFYLVTLNRANLVTGYAKISQGSISGTSVDIRIVAKYAVNALCSGVILAHNHPSGSLTPSNSDQIITDKIVDALNLFDIQVLDHIILTESSYYSFALDNLISPKQNI